MKRKKKITAQAVADKILKGLDDLYETANKRDGKAYKIWLKKQKKGNDNDSSMRLRRKMIPLIKHN